MILMIRKRKFLSDFLWTKKQQWIGAIDEALEVVEAEEDPKVTNLCDLEVKVVTRVATHE